jgi:hypothetical protein
MGFVQKKHATALRRTVFGMCSIWERSSALKLLMDNPIPKNTHVLVEAYAGFGFRK